MAESPLECCYRSSLSARTRKMLTIIGFSALIGCIVYLIVSIEYAFILRKNGILLLPAFLFSAIWALSTSHIYTFDFIYTAFWSGVFLAVFHSNWRPLPSAGHSSGLSHFSHYQARYIQLSTPISPHNHTSSSIYCAASAPC